MRFRDAYRAQYFIHALECEIQLVTKRFDSQHLFSKSILEVIDEFITQIAVEVDQIILPSIAHEIRETNLLNNLESDSSAIRYQNFFIQNGKYTSRARFLVSRYSFLFELVQGFIKSSFENLCNCINRLLTDRQFIQDYFFNENEIFIEKIQTIGLSDRHCGQRALLLSFSNSSKLIYKPTDLRPDKLFTEFVDSLKLPHPYNIKTMKSAPKNDYGWIEFISHQPCSQYAHLQNFFRRSGVLLALTDALNYTDGHCENLIAHGEFPILLDGETFFQNYPTHAVQNKNILSTLLIQKRATAAKQGPPLSAFQTPCLRKFDVFHPYALNDHTDEIQVHFKGFSNEYTQNSPVLDGKSYTAAQFVEEVIEGFIFAYNLLSCSSKMILSNDRWWQIASEIKSRAILRDTAPYFYLLRKIQQPKYACSKESAKYFLQEKLGKSPYTLYEIDDLMKLNIPYFYQRPGRRDFYDGNNKCYENIFPINAIESVRHQFLIRDKNKMEFNIGILKKHLRPIERERDLPHLIGRV